MNYKTIKTFSALLLLALITIVYSCNESDDLSTVDTIKLEQEVNIDFSQEGADEILKETITTLLKGSSLVEMEQMYGKTSEDFYNSDRTSITCLEVAPCITTPIHFSSVYANIAPGCDLEYSCDIYVCPSGVAIFNFVMQPTTLSTNCMRWDSMETLHAEGKLMMAQVQYNKMASTILSYIEDLFYQFIPTPSNGQFLIASYIPNICTSVCDDPVEEECGEDCCIRFAVFDNASQKRTSTSASSAGECGGDSHECTNGEKEDCINHNCAGLNLYGPTI